MSPYFADASAFPDIARQTVHNSINTLRASGLPLSGSTMIASRLDRRSLAEDAPFVCALFLGSRTCALTSTEAACDAESSYSCEWDPDNGCGLDTTYYSTEYDLKTDSSYQKLNSTSFSCNAYEDAASCNAVSSCTHEDDSCFVGALGLAEILGAYCPSQDLTSAQYVAQYDMCPYYTKAAKCAQYTSQQTCTADSDCDYDQDPTDPESSKYPCGAKDMSVATDLVMAHYVDVLLVTGTCRKYESLSACNADVKCDWEEGECGISDDAIASIFQNHPHMVRVYETQETCSDVSKAECGVGDTADKCQWLEASQGDNAECSPTLAFSVRQMSCECDGIVSAAPSVDVSDFTCEAPVVQFIDTGLDSGARAVAPIMVVLSALFASLAIFA